MAITRDNVYFDGANLISVSGLSILGYDPAVPKRSTSMLQLARENKGKLTGAYYTDRTVAVRACIQRDTRDNAEASYDDLMALLQGTEKQLIIPQSGGQRLYVATFQDPVYSIRGGSYLEFTLMFTCSDKFGYDLTQSTLLDQTGIITSSRTDPLTIQGSAALQAPYIRIVYTSLTASGSKTVNIGNSANGQAVSITRVWTSGDIIEIGPTTAGGTPHVRVNSVDVNFSGNIPQFPKGTITWIYTDNFTSRTFTAQIKYFKRSV